MQMGYFQIAQSIVQIHRHKTDQYISEADAEKYLGGGKGGGERFVKFIFYLYNN